MTHNYETVRRCCYCTAPAMGLYEARPYCAAHRPSVGRPPNQDDVARALDAMASGSSLKEVATALGLMATDLDLAMWRSLGMADDRPRRYAPDFEDVA